MLTVHDFRNLLVLISGDQLSLRGSQVATVAALQRELVQAINAAQAAKPKRPRKPKETPNGDSPRPAE